MDTDFKTNSSKLFDQETDNTINQKNSSESIESKQSSTFIIIIHLSVF